MIKGVVCQEKNPQGTRRTVRGNGGYGYQLGEEGKEAKHGLWNTDSVTFSNFNWRFGFETDSRILGDMVFIDKVLGQS